MTRNTKSLLPFLFGATLGAVLFIAVFGFAVVDPANTDWIFADPDDSAQHYLGWVFYRKTPWTFPLCLTDGLSSDGPVSCMFTDSIPLLAVIFKILSPVLPDTFQYLGLWGVICFALNGGCGAVLLHRIKPSLPFTAVGSVFYSAFIPSIARITHHNSLGAIWLIIIPMILCLDCERPRNWLKWAAVCALAVAVHVYFVPMIFMVMGGYAIILIFRLKQLRNAIITFASSVATVVLSMWTFGAFYGKGSYADSGFGLFSANLNTFVNSMGYSRVLPALASFDGQGEGFGFLGLGMLLCVAAALVSAVLLHKKVHDALRAHAAETAAFIAVFAVSMLWAVSSRITFGCHVIADIPLPHLVLSCLSVFRASGRFIWLPCLLIVTAALSAVAYSWKKYSAVAAAVCLTLQLWDILPWCTDTHRYYRDRSDNWALGAQQWDTLSQGTSEIVFLPLPADHLAYMQLYFDFARLADKHGLSLSSFYLARSDMSSVSAYAGEQYDLLCNGSGSADKLYVFFNSGDAPHIDGVDVYEMDGYTVARVKK